VKVSKKDLLNALMLTDHISNKASLLCFLCYL